MTEPRALLRSLFDAAVKASSFILDDVEEPLYDHELFVHYTASIIEHMGGRADSLTAKSTLPVTT